MDRFNSRVIKHVFLLLFLAGIVYSCIDGELLSPDPEAPIISSFNPELGLPGSTVFILGENFNGEPGMDSVYINGYSATVISSSPTQLEIIVPDDATTGPIMVEELIHQKRAVSLTDFEVLTTDPPGVEIHKVTPNAGIAGSSFQIIGANFGEGIDDIIVRIGFDTTVVSFINDTLIVTSVPVGAITAAVIVIKSGMITVGTEFTVLDVNPEIDTLKPNHGPVGTIVWIIGKYFSSIPADNDITFNGETALVIEAYNDSLLTSVPPDATTGKVIVNVNGKNGEWPLFTVDLIDPKITSIDPASGKVGITVTIIGENFSDIPSENTVTFNGAEAVVNSATLTELVVIVPGDATTGPVNVTVNGLTATGPQFVVESNQIEVTSINPTTGKVGISVKIIGKISGQL